MKKIERSRLVPGFTYWTVAHKSVGFFTSPCPAKVEILRTTKAMVLYRVGDSAQELSARDTTRRKAEQDMPSEADPLELSSAQETYERKTRDESIRVLLSRTGPYVSGMTNAELDELAALLARIHKMEKL